MKYIIKKSTLDTITNKIKTACNQSNEMALNSIINLISTIPTQSAVFQNIDEALKNTDRFNNAVVAHIPWRDGASVDILPGLVSNKNNWSGWSNVALICQRDDVYVLQPSDKYYCESGSYTKIYDSIISYDGDTCSEVNLDDEGILNIDSDNYESLYIDYSDFDAENSASFTCNNKGFDLYLVAEENDDDYYED